MDIVVDFLGGERLEDVWFCVKEGGALISIFEPPEEKEPKELKEKIIKNDLYHGAKWSAVGGNIETVG